MSHFAVVRKRSVDRLAEFLLQEQFGTQPKDLISRDALAITAIRIVLSRDLSSVPMSKIIEFRKQFSAELDVFQKWLHGETKRLREDTGGITSPSAMNEFLTELGHRRVKPQLAALRKQLRNVGIECAATALAIKVVTSFVPEIAAQWLNQPALRTAGFAFAAIPIAVKSSREAHKLVAGNPMAYLMHAQERLTPGLSCSE